MRKVRFLLLFLLTCSLLFSAAAIAKDRAWQPATLVAKNVQSRDGGAVAMPIGTMIAAVPITRVFVYYLVQTADTRYVLWDKRPKPRNLTLHGPTKIAVEGTNAVILDDAGKELKMVIVEKSIAPK